MSIATDPAQRARWLARMAHVENELTDLQREIDVSMRQRLTFSAMRALTHADVAIERARAELDTATAEIGAIQ